MAGVRYHKPHTTRHTFATIWRRRGLDIEEIQTLLGHASIRTTVDTYLHVDLSLIAEHMAALISEGIEE
jgi:site-specific recombinase XerD